MSTTQQKRTVIGPHGISIRSSMASDKNGNLVVEGLFTGSFKHISTENIVLTYLQKKRASIDCK